MVASVALFRPLLVNATSYVLQVDSNGTSEPLNFPASGSLTLNRYYWFQGDGTADADTNGGEGDLVGMLQTTLNSNTGGVTYAVSLNMDGRTLDVSADANFQLLWSHGSTTLPASTFGFDGSDVPSPADTSVSSDAFPTGIWHPDVPLSVDSREWPPIAGGVAMSISGKQRTSKLAEPANERTIGWALLTNAFILAEYAAATEDAFEEHWTEAIRNGYPVRLVEDSSDTTTWTLYKVRSLRKPVTRMGTDPGLINRWRVDLELVAV